MAETTADVRRDIELTRERMSTTLQQLEQKLNVMQVVRDNPWPALALAVGAGVLLSGSRTDVKAAAATAAATRGASSQGVKSTAPAREKCNGQSRSEGLATTHASAQTAKQRCVRLR